MENNELKAVWKAYDQKLDKVLSFNRELVYAMTKRKLNTTIGMMKGPKTGALLIGIPYTILLYFITFIGYQAGGFFVTLGFGLIGLIMTAVIVGYCYQLNLINGISRAEDILIVQRDIANLKISSFNLARLAVMQLPFWSVCWISVEALTNSPFLYGGINLVVFLGLAYLAYWIYTGLSVENMDTKLNKFFFAGIEWHPILKATEILAQLEALEDDRL